ncbi:MAG: hypothetical protein ACTHMV_13435 [Chitinophagaceae bacterium]
MAYELKKAAKCAEYIANLLSPYCKQIHIAGSIRRSKERVDDIEIVCEPQREFIETDLFGGGEWNVSRDFIEAVATITKNIIRGNVTGRYMRIATNSKNCPGIHIDLFMPAPDDYFRHLVIRTGSADYVHHVIAAAWLKKGWCGVKDLGLRPVEDCVPHIDKAGRKTWKLTAQFTTLPPAWKSEKEFFDWLKIPFALPIEREFKSLNIYQ